MLADLAADHDVAPERSIALFQDMSYVEPVEQEPAVSSELIGACERAWRSIQARHPDVPDVVLVLGTGVERGRLVKLGHWWDGRWVADGQVRGEVLLAGEALHLDPAQVFEVLLHEAAHGINAARGVKDTSRGGRYHNTRFKRTAEELGLVVADAPPYGWAATSIAPATAVAYEPDIAKLSEAMRIARLLHDVGITDGDEPGMLDRHRGGLAERGRVGKQPPATCGCGRRLRMAPSVLAQGPVVCGLCGLEFKTGPHAEPARSATDVPEAWSELVTAGLACLAELARTADGALLIAEIGAWREAGRYGDSPAISVSAAEELDRANDAARAVLKIAGELSGTPIRVAGRELLNGDLVVVGPHDEVLRDIDGTELPPMGLLGTVVSTHPERDEVVVDFAIAGEHRLLGASSAAHALRYGYAEVANTLGAPLIDLTTLPEFDPPPPPTDLSPTLELSW